MEEWHKKLESLLNDALKMEHYAFYFYRAAASHFEANSVALKNIAKFFHIEWKEELEHADKIIDFMNKMSLNIEFKELSMPCVAGLNVSEIFEKSLNMEKQVYEIYRSISAEANTNNDPTTSQFIDDFLNIQILEIQEFECLKKNAVRTQCGLGEFIFDQSFK